MSPGSTTARMVRCIVKGYSMIKDVQGVTAFTILLQKKKEFRNVRLLAVAMEGAR